MEMDTWMQPRQFFQLRAKGGQAIVIAEQKMDLLIWEIAQLRSEPGNSGRYRCCFRRIMTPAKIKCITVQNQNVGLAQYRFLGFQKLASFRSP